MITKKQVLSVARIICVALFLSAIAAIIWTAVVQNWAIFETYSVCVALIAGVGVILLWLCERKAEDSFKKQIFAVCREQLVVLMFGMSWIRFILFVADTYGIIAEGIAVILGLLLLKFLKITMAKNKSDQEAK